MGENDAGNAGPAHTVLDRLVAAGIDQERAQAHLQAGGVQVDGERVIEPARPSPWPARIVITGS